MKASQASRARDGWACLPQGCGDGGRSGGNIERRALQ
jgi:hypothetical protein